MKIVRFLIIVILSLQIACVSSAQQETAQQVKTERKPFQKSSHVIKQPRQHLHRELDNAKSYDPKPRVVVVDEKAGKYEFRWIGYDRKEKVVAYQRHDAIDAVVEASVEKTADGSFLYQYHFKILPTSPIYFRNFILQILTEDAKPVKIDNNRFYIGQRSNLNLIFKDGIWWSYAFVGTEEERIYGGNTLEFQLTSASLPGIVNCRAVGGEIATLGVGEELPAELDDLIPIFEDLASGYTIAPVESLSGLSKPERAKYLLENLPKFQEAGWMGETTAKNYESILKREDLQEAFEQAKKDLENEFITSEVFHIIEGLNQ